jgi:hypothetical protein
MFKTWFVASILRFQTWFDEDILNFQFELCYRFFGFFRFRHFGATLKKVGKFFSKTSSHPDKKLTEVLFRINKVLHFLYG